MKYLRSVAVTIGEASNPRRAVAKFAPLSLEQLLQRHPAPKWLDRRAYYVETTPDGKILFGIDRSSRLVEIPGPIYRALGSPDEYTTVPLHVILEKVGYL